jgi:hypothetical protein
LVSEYCIEETEKFVGVPYLLVRDVEYFHHDFISYEKLLLELERA